MEIKTFGISTHRGQQVINLFTPVFAYGREFEVIGQYRQEGKNFAIYFCWNITPARRCVVCRGWIHVSER